MGPAIASGLGQTFVVGTNMRYYRFILPLALGSGVHGGVWHALLTVDERDFKKQVLRLASNDQVAYRRAVAHGARYSFTAQTYSTLKMEARVSQTSLQPGAILTLHTNLTEYGLPVERRADVQAELQRPDTTSTVLSLTEIEPGVFETSIAATWQGIYRFRVIASGVTLCHVRFTREQALTGTVIQGGDNPPPTSGTDPRTRDEQLCYVIECLLNDDVVRRFLGERGMDIGSLATCLRSFCEERLTELLEGGAGRMVRFAGA